MSTRMCVVIMAAMLFAAAGLAGASDDPLAIQDKGAPVFSGDFEKFAFYTEPLCPGDEILYEITLANTSDPMTDALPGLIIDQIPPGTTYVADSATNDAFFDGGFIQWFGDLGPGASHTISFRVTNDEPSGALIRNVATGFLGSLEFEEQVFTEVDCGDTTPPFTPIGIVQHMIIEQIDFTAEYSGSVPCSEYGEIQLWVEPDPLELRFLQIGGGLKDGPQDWVVRNLPVFPINEHIPTEIVDLELVSTGASINLIPLGVQRGECVAGDIFEFDIIETPLPILEAPSFDPFLVIPFGSGFNNAQGDVPLLPLAPPSLPPPFIDPVAGVGEVFLYLGRPGMKNVEQGNNECGPGAVANSMHWLDATGAIDLGDETPEQSLEKLKLDMQPGGWAGDGVTQKETVEGKLRFAWESNHNLDIHYQADSSITDLGAQVTVEVNGTNRTARRDGDGGKPTFDYLFGEIAAGQDVELSLDWLDADGNKTGGHVVTVSGVTIMGDFKSITFNDDRDQGDEGGLRTNHFATIEDDNGYMRLGGLARNRVKAIYAESPNYPELPAFPLDESMSGSWFDPSSPGQGLLIEELAVPEPKPVELSVIYWFTYPPGDKGLQSEQAWFVGVGETRGNGIVIEQMLSSQGGQFGPDFDPDDVELTSAGSMVVRFRAGCDDAIMSYGTPDQGSGTMRLERITNIEGLDVCEDLKAGAPKPLAKTGLDGSYSGSWFDPAHEGEGWLIEILPGGSAVVYWFSYDTNGNQAWFVGVGTINGKTITVDDVRMGVGTFFGAGFDPSDVTLVPWGSWTFTFDGCNSGTMTYSSVLPEFGTGALNMQRITALNGLSCSD